MKDKKLQVFVSSTYLDLKEERQAAVEAILSAGHIPAGMELFSAGDESQMTVIERWIDESDVYMLILGGRYGSVDPKSGKSYTQLEYEYALNKSKPLFAVVINESALDAKISKMGKLAIEDENPKELKVFRKLVMKKMVKPWDDTKDIKLAVYDTLSDFMHNKELIGWIRGDNAVNSVVIADEIARLTKENSELRLSNENIQKDNAIRYNGQTFETLRDHLTSINIENLNSNGQLESLSLYNMFIDKGHLFTDGTPSIDSKFEALLLLYKIIKRIGKENISRKLVNGILPDRYWTTYSCYFTDDGHNFYLECLTRNKITNPLHVSINKLLDSTGISTSNSED